MNKIQLSINCFSPNIESANIESANETYQKTIVEQIIFNRAQNITIFTMNLT